jgi:hypothetical protein
MTDPTNTTPATARRLAYTQGLRDLADFLDTHPDVPEPKYTVFNVFVYDKAALATAARAARWEKVYNGEWFSLRQTFGEDVSLDINVQRSLVCTRIVTGTRVVPAKAEEIVEEVEWVCHDSLLSAGEAR